jgi:hypothetical protein
MKTLFLHIGTHKTATTTLQKTFSSSQELLIDSGIYYPNYDIIDAKKHYSHHDIARSIAGGPNARFTHEQLVRFFSALEKRTPEDGICFISSEIFYRINIHSNKQKRGYIAKVKNYASLSGMHCKVVITLREQASFLDSLYREHVRQTNYAENFDAFLEKFSDWINYKNQLELWANALGVPKVLFYERLNKEKLPEEFLEKSTGRRLNLSHRKHYNSSLNYDWTQVKRIINFMSLGKWSREETIKIINNLQSKTPEGASPNHPKTHFISESQAAQLYQIHAKDNAYIAKTFCDQESLPPFVQLKIIPPTQPLVNTKFLLQAIIKIFYFRILTLLNKYHLIRKVIFMGRPG